MNYPAMFGVMASVLQVLGYITYNRSAEKGKNLPSLATWLMVLVISFCNARIYLEVSGAWWPALQFWTGFLGSTYTFIRVACLKRFGSLTRADLKIMAVVAVGILTWRMMESALLAYFIFVGLMVLSLVPIARGICAEPVKEDPIPWWLITGATTCTGLSTLIDKGLSVALIAPAALLAVYGFILFHAASHKHEAYGPS